MLTNIDVFVRYVEKALYEKYQEKAENLSTGSARSFEEYKTSVGYISGLKEAEEIVKEAKRKADEAAMGA